MYGESGVAFFGMWGGEMGSGETFTYAAAVELVVAAREVHSFALVPLVVIPASEARGNGT